MIVTWRIALRLALIIVVAVVLQISFFSFLSILGATPDFLSVVVVSIGLLGGGVVGAVCGFAAGLLLDSALLETLGVSSLVLLAVGYLAGRYREGFEITNSLTPALLAAGLTFVGAAGFAALQLMLGVETQVSLLVVREIVIKGLLAFLLALPFYPLVRRLLRPALVDEAPRRRALARVAARRRRRGRTSRISRRPTIGAPARGGAGARGGLYS
jgi:rod shape-determining protein MreD